MSVKIEFKGLKELQAALKKAGQNGPVFLDRALYAEALEIFAASQKLVPVDTGALRASGVLVGPRGDGVQRGTPYGGPVSAPMSNPVPHQVLIGYGGVAGKYAEIVHEDLSANHAGSTSAKYLERPFEKAKSGMQSRLAKRVKMELEANNG